MNYRSGRHLGWIVLLPLLIGVGLILNGCDSGGGSSPDPNLKNGVAISGSDQSNVAAIATHKEGEWLTAYSREGPNQVSEVVYGDGDGNRATIKFDNQGRPSLAVTGPYVLTFGNFNGSRADVALLDTRTGEIKTFEQIDLGIEISSLNLAKAGRKELSPAEATQAAGYGATAFFCAAAVVPAPDSPFTGALCAGSVLAQVATTAAEQAGWGDTAEWVGFGVDVGSCAGEGGTGPSCVEALVDAADVVFDEDQNQVDENEGDIAQASGVARFGGIWNYRDINKGWFVMKENLSYDAIYNSSEDCYRIVRLDFLEVDGNNFRYERRSDGTEIRAEFSLMSEDVLTATRLSDGAEFTWDRDSSQDTQVFFDNECASSSAFPSAKTLSQ